MKKVYDIAEVRMPQINTELANLKTEIKVAQAMVDKINEKMKGMDKNRSRQLPEAIRHQQALVQHRLRCRRLKRDSKCKEGT